jgi:hypothetical protein
VQSVASSSSPWAVDTAPELPDRTCVSPEVCSTTTNLTSVSTCCMVDVSRPAHGTGRVLHVACKATEQPEEREIRVLAHLRMLRPGNVRVLRMLAWLRRFLEVPIILAGPMLGWMCCWAFVDSRHRRLACRSPAVRLRSELAFQLHEAPDAGAVGVDLGLDAGYRVAW